MKWADVVEGVEGREVWRWWYWLEHEILNPRNLRDYDLSTIPWLVLSVEDYLWQIPGATVAAAYRWAIQHRLHIRENRSEFGLRFDLISGTATRAGLPYPPVKPGDV